MTAFFRMIGGVGTFFFVLLVVIILTLAIYWPVHRYNLDQDNRSNVGSQQYQASLIQQERDRVAAYDDSTNDAQKKDIKSSFCAIYSDITVVPNDLMQANARICA